MQRSIVFRYFSAFACIVFASCQAFPKKPLTTEEWAARRHPPSDKGPLPEGCKPVKYRGGYYPITEAFEGSGRHCVIHDFVQRKARDWIEGGIERGNPRGAILDFYHSNNADLDLQGHLVTGRPFNNNSGIGILSGGEVVFNLRVHNGIIETPGLSGIGVELSPKLGARNRIEKLEEDFPVIENSRWNIETQKFNKIPWDYFPPTFYTAENLQIKSGGRAVIMAGSDNVVRNNTIEVDGRTAVYLYGPRSLVEGNTFIVHMDLRDKAPLPAILKLRDADGSIIRSNRFIVKRSGLFRKKEEEPQAGINLLESKGVVIEGNVFEEITLPVRKDAASTTTESGNISKGSP